MNKLNKFALLLVFGMAAAYGAETRNVKSSNGKVVYLQAENRYWRLNFNSFGGRLMSIFYKPAKTELTDPDTVGCFTENVWNVPTSRYFLRERPFQFRTFEKDGRFVIAAEGNHQGGGIDFLKVHKTYSISDNDRILSIDYAFENMPAAMARLNYAILIHTNLAVSEEKCTNYYPTEDGIRAVSPASRPNDIWFHRPARGWIAAVAPSGKGVALTMPEKEVGTFYSWFAKDKVPTLEWRMVPFGVDAGKRYHTKVEVIPFTGLKKVSGAGSGLVGEIDCGTAAPEPGDKVPVEIRVYNGRSGPVSAELFAKRPKDREWTSLKKAELGFPDCGLVRSFKAEVMRKDEGLLELEVVLKMNGKEAARLNAAVDFGESGEKWTLSPLVRKMESSIKSVDLTDYKLNRPMPHIPWAKPLPGKKLKVLALVSHTNIPEILRLGLTLDMDWKTTYLGLANFARKMMNPIYSNGDHFGILTGVDIDNNLKKAAGGKYDAILIGGFPWDVFPAPVRKRLLDQVRNGAGLVYIGADKPADFLPLKDRKGTLKAVPEAVTDTFAGIPFELLGKESIYRYRATGKVHATAGGVPYLVESKLGKGRILALNYRAMFGRFGTSAGLTPDLQDFYPDRGSPHEFYYSLIAKTILHAAGRSMPVTFAGTEIKDGRAAFALNSSFAGETRWEVFIMDRFQERKYSAVQTAVLKPGKQTVILPLQTAPFAGKQSLSVIIRNLNGEVLNWGSWPFEYQPAAAISGLKTGKTAYSEGEEVAFQLKIAGKSAGKQVHVTMTDSYDRVIAETILDAAENISGRLKIRNELPARSYTLTARLLEDQKAIDRRQTSFLGRPAADKLKWDDYEVGTWMTGDGVRFYLWKEQAELLHDINIKTLISNWNSLALRFPVRYNFHPTMLQSAGLGRAGEPAAYTKTGDKMKLVRKPCLSDPAFQKKTAETFSKTSRDLYRYALRFIWLGDEQSITSYGGLPVDFCFSPHCLGEFRKFLQKRYGSLARLNQAWETAYSTWADVLPKTRQEIWAAKGKHVAAWADHLEFMDSRLENIVRTASMESLKTDPECRISISGTQNPTAYGGMDWWRQMKVFNSLMNYYVGGQHEIQRSFRKSAEFMPWRWGYGGMGASAVNRVWETAFLGFKGIMGFSYTSQVRPDWRYYKGLSDTLPHLTRLTSGTGKYMLNSFRSAPQTAVLYSQASIRAAFIENRRDQHRLLREKYIALLRNTGCEFDFISYEQLEQGILDKGTFKTLILPDSSALSDKEIAAVLRFAENGGCVIAEGIPARREQNCKLRSKPALAGLFRDKRHLLIPNPDTVYLDALKYPGSPDNAKIIEKEQNRLEAVLQRQPEFRRNRICLADSMTGKPYRHAYHYIRQDRSGNRLFAMLSPEKKERQIRISFPAKGHIYNLVDGRYYGETDSLSLPFGQGIPYAFAVLPRKTAPGALKISNGCLKVSGVYPLDSAVRIRFFAPDGKEVRHYRKNLLMKEGKAEMPLPFALSDPKGIWKITAKEVVGGLENSIPYELR